MRKILIVEDLKSLRMLYADELAGEGYDIIFAGRVSGIMQKIAASKPDIVVLDIMLSNVNGLDLLWDIRREYGKLPVIINTGYPMENFTNRFIDADRYIFKSSDVRELKQAIKTILAFKERGREYHPAQREAYSGSKESGQRRDVMSSGPSQSLE